MRYRSSATFLETPWLAIAIGPDADNHEMRGHARGIVAIGDMATGVFAFGGLSRGVVALGGLAMGGIALGGLGIGLLALGGLAVGYIAAGGAALGYIAGGGLAIGYYAIGGAVFIHAQPNQKRCFDCGCEKSDRVQCRNSVTKHFKQRRRGSQSCHAEMNRQQHAVQKPRRYRCRADQHTRISSEQHSEDRRAKNENARRDAKTLVECARKNLMRV